MDAQVASANELHQHAVKYCSQLQTYNAKLQEELQTLGEQLRGAQARPRCPVASPHTLQPAPHGHLRNTRLYR